MLCKVLVPLSGNENVKGIASFVASLEKSRETDVLGLGIVDVEGMEDSLAGAPPGAIEMAEGAVKKISTQQEMQAKEFITATERLFSTKGINYEGKVREGSPLEQIQRNSVGFDLMVVSRESIFSYGKHEEDLSFFMDLISGSHIPVILLSGEKPGSGVVGLASDFGMDAGHSLYSFLQLGILKQSRVLLTHVSDEEGVSGKFNPYRSLFMSHGFEDVEVSILKGEKESAVRRFVETEKVDLLVIGKKGESRLKEYLFGSLTESLVKDPPCSLFIHE